MRILAISGSLQERSSNTRLLEAARAMAPDGVDVVLFASLAEVPPFNPDLEDAAGPAVAELRAGLAAADAVLIATPEYAHGLPGTLKNALDWIVGSGELYAKPVAVMSAAPSAERGAHAREMLGRTLGAQGAKVVSSSTVQVARSADGELGAVAVAAVGAVLRTVLERDPSGSDPC